MCCHKLIAGGNKCILHDSTGRGFLEACDRFPLHVLYVPFPSADFAIHPLTVINHSHKYNYMLIAGSPPGESSNLGVVFGTPNTDNRQTDR